MFAGESIYYVDELTTLHHGDSLKILSFLSDESVDAVVTDPPAGIGIIGNEWDSDRGGRLKWIAWLASVFREVMRVLKPGAHAFVWALPRTSHWTGTALEDAGFEVRDRISHLFGGNVIPKNLDIAKAIDRSKDVRKEVLRVTVFLKRARIKAGKSNADIDEHFGTNGMGGHWCSTKAQPAVPTIEQWWKLKAFLGFGDEMDAEAIRMNADKGVPGEEFFKRKIVDQRKGVNFTKMRPVSVAAQGLEKSASKIFDVTAAHSEDAKKWDGFGTALRPLMEDWWLVRKPLRGNIQKNVRSYGAGAINIEASRISDRYPSNVVIAHGPECVEGKCVENCPISQLGSAASYFNVFDNSFIYSAKPTRAEKERGSKNTHPTVKGLHLMRHLVKMVTPPNGVVLDLFAGSGSTLAAAKSLGFRSIGIEGIESHCKIIAGRLEAIDVGEAHRKKVPDKIAKLLSKKIPTKR